MVEEIISLRKQNSKDKFNLKEQKVINEKYKLSRRKTKLFNSLMEKRFKTKIKLTRQIAFSDILLESDFKTKIKMLKEFLDHSRCDNFPNEESDYLNNILLPQLTTCLFDNSTDIFIKEYIVRIFIELFDSFASYFIDVVFLTQLKEQIVSSALSPHRLYCNLLIILLSNLLNEDKENHHIITNTINVPLIVQSTYYSICNREANYGIDDMKTVLFILITNFLFYYDNDAKVKHISIAQNIIIPEIVNSYGNMNSNVFFRAIQVLNSFANCKDPFFTIVIQDKELISILNEVMITKANQSTVIELYCAFATGTEVQIAQLLNEKIINCFMNNVLTYCYKIKSDQCSIEDKKMLFNEEGHALIYSIRAISNIICNEKTVYYSPQLLKKESNVMDSLLNCFMSFNNDNIQNEIINMLIKELELANGSLNEVLIVHYKIHEVFSKILIETCLINYNVNEDLITNILKLINAIFASTSHTDLYSNIKRQLQQLDFIDNLTKIQLRSSSEIIPMIIESILSIHWSENEIYYNVCNDSMNVR